MRNRHTRERDRYYEVVIPIFERLLPKGKKRKDPKTRKKSWAKAREIGPPMNRQQRRAHGERLYSHGLGAMATSLKTRKQK
jgi:hypothetical protein